MQWSRVTGRSLGCLFSEVNLCLPTALERLVVITPELRKLAVGWHVPVSGCDDGVHQTILSDSGRACLALSRTQALYPQVGKGLCGGSNYLIKPLFLILRSITLESRNAVSLSLTV